MQVIYLERGNSRVSETFLFSAKQFVAQYLHGDKCETVGIRVTANVSVESRLYSVMAGVNEGFGLR